MLDYHKQQLDKAATSSDQLPVQDRLVGILQVTALTLINKHDSSPEPANLKIG